MFVLKIMKPYAVFSGGWAWHFMSKTGHTEFKHAHDHKDVDIFVPKHCVSATIALLVSDGFQKAHTIYDKLPSEEDFRRYEKTVPCEEHPSGTVRLTIDFFVDPGHPTLETPEGWKVVRPDVLLSFYGKKHPIHDSNQCWAVQSAKKLLANGETPENFVERPELSYCPDLDLYHCGKCNWVGQFPFQDETLNPLPRHPTTCGGCKKYLTRNMGKPGYHPRAKVEGMLRKGS